MIPLEIAGELKRNLERIESLGTEKESLRLQLEELRGVRRGLDVQGGLGSNVRFFNGATGKWIEGPEIPPPLVDSNGNRIKGPGDPEPSNDIRKIGDKVSDAADRVVDTVQNFRELLSDRQEDVAEAFDKLEEIGESLNEAAQEPGDESESNLPPWLPWAVAGGVGIWGITRKPK